jgi:tRNA pseudouridine38-40 synthase
MPAALLIEYDGTEFAGWASQPGQRTVQSELDRALSVVLRRPEGVPLRVAGRTDAGVHALGQVASYEGEPAGVRSLNALLPTDVSVLECVEVRAGFDARRDATSRAYCYRVLARPGRAALHRTTALHVERSLQSDVLHACARALVGTHDFTAFTPADTYHVRFEREVYAAFWRELDAGVLEFWIEADAFMRQMNRVLVGTMIDAAAGRRSAGQFAALLTGAPRSQAGPTAPALGLHLAAVGYGGRRLLDPGASQPANFTLARLDRV